MNAGWNPFFYYTEKNTGFTSSTFPIQRDFSQNQLATITLNTGSPQTLFQSSIYHIVKSFCGSMMM